MIHEYRKLGQLFQFHLESLLSLLQESKGLIIISLYPKINLKMITYLFSSIYSNGMVINA